MSLTHAPLEVLPARPGAHARPPGRRLLPAPRVTVALLVGVLACVLRAYGHSARFDVFVDEFVYQGLGHSVRHGGFPRAGGQLFFLHPPGFFYLEGLWEDIAGAPVDVIAAVDQARVLNAILSGVTALALVLLVGRRSLPWGAWAALVFAVEPFALRQNGRVLLETATMSWALLGLVVLVPLLMEPDRPRAHLRALCGGVLMGLAILTKDTAVFLTMLPLAAAYVVIGKPHRRWLRTAIVSCALPYAVFVAVLAANGHADEWSSSKLGGLARASGADVTTGFTSAGAPSLLGQVLAQLPDFAATYPVLVIGGLAALHLLLRGTAAERVLALVYGGAAFLLTYSFAFGTLEEQFLYFPLVPAIACAGASGARLTAGRSWRTSRTSLVALTTLAALVLTWDAGIYARWTAHSDNGYGQLRAYLATVAPPGSAIMIVNGVTEFALKDRYRVGPFTSDEQRKALSVRYLVVPWKEVVEGYAYVSLPDVNTLTREGTLVFRHDERTYGEVAVYRMPIPQ